MSKNNSEEAIERIIHLMRTDDSVDAPEDAVRWSKNLFRARAAEPKKSVVQKVLAVLQIDLSPNRAAFGERSASAGQARQMLFQAGDSNIDLRVKQTESNFDLHGQILGEDFSGGIANLGDFQAEINELGEFKFAQIPKGKYDFHLRKEESEIVIENLELK